MLELLTTDAFAAWFRSLDAAPAEDVAATLEVIAQLGVRAEAPGSTDALLWYEHPSVAGRDVMGYWKDAPPEIIAFARDWGRFNGYVRRVVKHLESPQFRTRLAKLSDAEAAIVTGALQRIRRGATTRLLAMGEFRQKNWAMFLRGGPTARQREALAGFLDETEVREAYFAALAAAGFEVADVPPNHAALREITLRATPPGLRLLYGIDEVKSRGLVVLGEWLDRTFYGDSVRRAEALWGQFLGGQPLPTQPAAAR
jgi:hypothetical protein